MFMGPRHWFQGMNSASLWSLAGRYENPIPPRCLAPIDFLKIPALILLRLQEKMLFVLICCVRKNSFGIRGKILLRLRGKILFVLEERFCCACKEKFCWVGVMNCACLSALLLPQSPGSAHILELRHNVPRTWNRKRQSINHLSISIRQPPEVKRQVVIDFYSIDRRRRKHPNVPWTWGVLCTHWAITCRKSNINFTVIPNGTSRFINRAPELEQSSGIIQKLGIKALTKPETKKGIRT